MMGGLKGMNLPSPLGLGMKLLSEEEREEIERECMSPEEVAKREAEERKEHPKLDNLIRRMASVGIRAFPGDCFNTEDQQINFQFPDGTIIGFSSDDCGGYWSLREPVEEVPA